MKSDRANKIVSEIIAHLQNVGAVGQAEVCGSLRRGKPEVHDADLLLEPLVCDDDLNEALAKFAKTYESNGERIKRFFYKGIKIDMMFCREPKYWGAMKLFRTGNGDFNISLRVIAKRKGWKMNELGLYERETGKRLRANTEEELLKKLGYKFIPPADRNPKSLKGYKL